MSSSDTHRGYVFYYYVPNLPAAVTFAALFGLSSTVHGAQIIRGKTWYFLPMLIGGFFETVGYVGRILSHSDNERLMPFILQSTLILVAPALFAASIYIILGRIMVFVHGEHYSMVKVHRLTKVFVIGDVFSFLIQSSGAGLMATGNPNSTKTGQDIVLAGLFIQIIWFGLFVVCSMRFHSGIKSGPTLESRNYLANPPRRFSWSTMLWALYITSLMIMVRSIFRVVEFIQGHDGFTMRKEVFVYVFDGALMLISLVVFNVVHPSNVFGHIDTKPTKA